MGSFSPYKKIAFYGVFFLSFLLFSSCKTYKKPNIVSSEGVLISFPSPGPIVFSLPNDEKLEMLGVGKGTFIMGTPLPIVGDGGKGIDYPRGANGHKVTLTDDYWMGKYEVTIKQYKAVLGNVPEHDTHLCNGEIDNMNRHITNASDDSCPVLATWRESMQFVSRLNDLFKEELPSGYHFALPTEAQWEYACRAGTTKSFNNGMEPRLQKSKNGWIWDNEQPDITKISWLGLNEWEAVPHQVGQKEPNAWGFFDMHGNVAEWCLDVYDDYEYEEIPLELSTGLLTSRKRAYNKINPTGPNKDSVSEEYKNNQDIASRVYRGGEGSMQTFFGTSWHRNGDYESTCQYSICGDRQYIYTSTPMHGFRVVLTTEQREQRDQDNNQYGADWADEEMICNSFCDANHIMMGYALKALPGVLETASQTLQCIEQFNNIANDRNANAENTSSGNNGFGVIAGRTTLNEGQTTTYKLYVGGKLIDNSQISWSSGTSIFINSKGGAVAKTPPVQPGKYFKTSITACYKGKIYSKNISIYHK